MERCVGCVVAGSGALLVDLEVLDENGGLFTYIVITSSNDCHHHNCF